MNILILNSGSSSIKYQLIKMPAETVICKGLIERIGAEDAKITHESDNQKVREVAEFPNHKIGLELMVKMLTNAEFGVISSPEEIEMIGHRVVHGGSKFTGTTLIADSVKDEIRELIPLAPLHNPANLEGIVMAEEIFPNAKQVAVFDTAFHRTIPERAAKYAIPNKLFYDENIRLYGFHGTSHKYISEKAIQYLEKPDTKIISIHLGNGCSVTAIHKGESIDHSLGFAPSNGLIMGTRSGDIDHSVIFYLIETLGYKPNELKDILNKQSGMLGLTGFSDLRDIQREAENGNADCKLALEMNAYRVKKYIGAYTAAMNGVDAIIFTAGIGENSSLLRRMICEEMDYLGIEINNSQNEQRSDDILEISTTDSRVKVLVIPTNEELEIAKQAYDLSLEN
ncbi:MAG: acetate kinase [Spirosomataceae bacterium]